MILKTILLVGLAAQHALARPQDAEKDDLHMHKVHRTVKRSAQNYLALEEENTAEFWNKHSQLTLNAKLQTKENKNKAKNVILFLGDGMSIPTLAAARAYEGQRNGRPGEETYLSFEEFPYTALSKTYCVDTQVADSACTATAYLCGVKANMGTIGVTGQVPYGQCKPSMNSTTHVSSIARWSQLKNKRTGLVTTTRVTHASPAGVYANVADRDWECDGEMPSSVSPKDCPDIAYQLMFGETGKNLNVIMGGGRQQMLPEGTVDEEGSPGKRKDGLNLVQEWLKLKQDVNAKYVWNRTELLEGVPQDTDYLLGLFEGSHTNYNLERTKEDPSLAEMTEAAIKVLSRGDEGFFLFVEGGRIDHAHHGTLAQKALDETVEFSEAIRRARQLTDARDTLVVVTSDHAHTMSLNGYPTRGNDILGISGLGDDNLPYSTLSYANGPGYRKEEDGKRHDISKDDMKDKDYYFPSLVPLDSETHGGDDVGIFATGPWSHLYRGVVEQNLIPHIMAYASCVGDGVTLCDS